MSDQCPHTFEHCKRREVVMADLLAACETIDASTAPYRGEDMSPEKTYTVSRNAMKLVRAAIAIAKAPGEPYEPDCRPCDHEIVAESGPFVHCPKCQRSGRRVDGMIRWSG